MIIGLVMLGPLSACSRSKPEPAGPPELKYEKYTLQNGLDVILSEDHRLPMVAVDIWYHVGPAYEAAGRTGFAHLFEHMMFEGSKHVAARQHFQVLESIGGTTLNGTTDFDRTNYFETVPANELETALWLESDRMGYLLDTLDQAKLTNQQDVVRNERRQSIENAPYGIVGEAVFHSLYPKSHPYYADVMGSHEDIQSAKLDDVRNFFRQYYAPNNASLAIAGDFDAAATRQLVQKYFGPFKRGPEVPKVTTQTPQITAERRSAIKDHVELPRVYMAWITPAFFEEGDADADVTANALGGDKSSRLYKKLVYEKQIAQDVAAEQQSLVLGSAFQIIVTARPGHKPEEIEAAIDEEMNSYLQNGPEQKEIERARNTFESSRLEGLEVLGGFGGVADTLNEYNYYVNDPGYLGKDLERYQRVTPATAKAFANAYLKKNQRVVIYGVPGEPDLGPTVPTPPPAKVAAGASPEAVNADEPWRKDRPKPAQAHAVQLPTPKSFMLDNGLTVIYNERPGMPVVAASLVVNTGGESNPIAKSGLANFAVGMLNQGTTTRNALQIADDTAQIGASMDTSSTKDDSSITVQALRKNFPAALDLLADVALHPNFPQAEVERERASRAAGFAQQRQDPNVIASVVAVSALFGPKSSYGFIESGTEESVKSITRDDLVGFWKQSFVPNNAALIVAGAITETDLRALVDKTFGSWQKGTPLSSALGTPAMTPARVLVVDKPGSPQTAMFIATLGAPRSTPDYAAMNVMNTALGGLFSSRINLNLREGHGYTYGAFSQFIFRRNTGPFWVSSGIRTDATAPAIAETLKEIARISAAPMPPEELAMARDSLTRSLPSSFETSGSTVGSLAELFTFNLGLDYYSKYPALISAVTAEAAQAAAKKYLQADKMIVVLVGDRAKFEPTVRKLNLGAFEFRNPDGTVAKGNSK
jgi:zinc protease